MGKFQKNERGQVTATIRKEIADFLKIEQSDVFIDSITQDGDILLRIIKETDQE